jgi:allophanate hydrolase
VSEADRLDEVHTAVTAHAAATAAWISVVDREAFLTRASAVDPALPLAGVPFAVKDNIDVAGLPTTAACPEYAYRPDRSAVAVARLEAAGAICVGKTNLDQFATGLVGTRSPYGACSSVDDPGRVSGGSSSGSGVAVGAGVVPLALGTDTAGSGRIPAAFNGIVGVKPTRGTVATEGVVPACRSLDCVSVFAGDVALARRAMTVLADPGLRQGRPALSRLRVRLGVPSAAGLAALDAESAHAWTAACRAAEQIADELLEVDLAPFVAAGRLLYGGPWVAERQAVAAATLERGGPGIDPVVRAIVLGAGHWTAADAFASQAELAALAERTRGTWERIDVLLLPTAPSHPTHAQVSDDPVGVNDRLGRFTAFANLLDLCAIAVPAGRRADRLPFGVTLLAPAFGDAALLDLAARWPAGPETVDLVVCGAHMRGMPLNADLRRLGASFVRATTTTRDYRLFALPGGPPPRPGLLRTDERDGGAIDVEVWRVPVAALGRVVAAIPAPLGVGTVALADGTASPGFLCESHAVAGAEEITAWGGWRSYLAGAPVA